MLPKAGPGRIYWQEREGASFIFSPENVDKPSKKGYTMAKEIWTCAEKSFLTPQ